MNTQTADQIHNAARMAIRALTRPGGTLAAAKNMLAFFQRPEEFSPKCDWQEVARHFEGAATAKRKADFLAICQAAKDAIEYAPFEDAAPEAVPAAE